MSPSPIAERWVNIQVSASSTFKESTTDEPPWKTKNWKKVVDEYDFQAWVWIGGDIQPDYIILDIYVKEA